MYSSAIHFYLCKYITPTSPLLHGNVDRRLGTFFAAASCPRPAGLSSMGSRCLIWHHYMIFFGFSKLLLTNHLSLSVWILISGCSRYFIRSLDCRCFYLCAVLSIFLHPVLFRWSRSTIYFRPFFPDFTLHFLFLSLSRPSHFPSFVVLFFPSFCFFSSFLGGVLRTGFSICTGPIICLIHYATFIFILLYLSFTLFFIRFCHLFSCVHWV